MRPGALLHRVRMAAAAVWRLAPGRYFAIPDGDAVVVLPLAGLTRIGRRATADIVLDDNTVSRRHALVLERDGDAVIADDRSLNGVYVNGRRVQPGAAAQRRRGADRRPAAALHRRQALM